MLNINKVVVGVAGAVAVIAAIIVTQSAIPLWGLILVCCMIESCD